MTNLNYGVVGNCTTAALISRDGCIEWCCLPSFDSPSVFAKILDKNRGGEFGVQVSSDYKIRQAYIDKTNVLVTTFSRNNDKFELIDFMPRYKGESGKYHHPPDIIRYVRHISGKPEFRIVYDPRPCFGRYDVKTEVRNEYIKTGTLEGSYESVYLYSDLDLGRIANRTPIAIKQDCYLLLSYNQKLVELDLDAVRLEYEKTRVYWLNWSANTRRFSRFNETIIRSALVLKLLSYQKTGAILAAVTTSLPEALGTGRNWDYRYCWLRDASMCVAVLTKLGHYRVAKRFLDFILDIIPYKDEKIQTMYGIDGQKILKERELDFLDGYENCKPVRIGNAAYTQKQNDIFGELLDVIYQYLGIFKREVVENKEDIWTVVRTLARHVERNWTKKDRGIWEFRGRKKHFTFSKLLSWVAMDRAMKIAGYFGMDNYVNVWSNIRDKIEKDIHKKGWNTEVHAFVQAYGENHLDASTLLMEHYGFLQGDNPKFVSTVRLTEKRLSRDGLMYRYRNEDDFGMPQSSFTICTFWFIKALYKIGEKEKAEKMFQKVLSYRNHVGLLSEDIDFETKRLLGNFPQGYSHIALIDAAITLCGECVTDQPHEFRES
ncbi:MAG: glycoside hydrolase family 15 protein [Desulfobacterales bacterium]|jgi:GH15 family glucan-1,4-alpha-glucosidase